MTIDPSPWHSVHMEPRITPELSHAAHEIDRVKDSYPVALHAGHWNMLIEIERSRQIRVYSSAKKISSFYQFANSFKSGFTKN